MVIIEPKSGGHRMETTNSRFNLGHICLTIGVNDLVAENPPFAKFVTDCLYKHAMSDWGNLEKEDVLANERALVEGSRLFSAYEGDDLPKIWVITEADRSTTTILFPDEY